MPSALRHEKNKNYDYGEHDHDRSETEHYHAGAQIEYGVDLVSDPFQQDGVAGLTMVRENS